jgi:hypothetical protein
MVIVSKSEELPSSNPTAYLLSHLGFSGYLMNPPPPRDERILRIIRGV